jgi:hypothetical protein
LAFVLALVAVVSVARLIGVGANGSEGGGVKFIAFVVIVAALSSGCGSVGCGSVGSIVGVGMGGTSGGLPGNIGGELDDG